MKMSSPSICCLHALAYLAREMSTEPVAAHDLAKASGTKDNLLRGRFGFLVHARIVRPTKGPCGGYALARPAKDISLLQVIEAMEGPFRGDVPALGTGKAGAAALDERLQAVCDEAARLVRQRLAMVTVADLAKGK
jgi:Rrf2 family protein